MALCDFYGHIWGHEMWGAGTDPAEQVRGPVRCINCGGMKPMESKLEEVLRDVAKFLEMLYATGRSHTEAQELLTRVREQIGLLEAPPQEQQLP